MPGHIEHSRNPLLAAAEAHLHCVLQPIVDLRSGVPHAYEALLRGHEALGFADPLALLDGFAASGLIPTLEAVLHKRAADTFARALSCPGGAIPQLFINIDPRALEHAGPALMEATIKDFAYRGLPADRLCWELSERQRVGVDGDTVRLMKELREAGVRFAADDFGQGHSELKLLFDQQIDYIKIDKFFIGSLPESGRRRLFVKKIASFAHTLGLKVVAEGVETAETLMVCRDLGCDLAQGWFIGRPTAAPDGFAQDFPHVTDAAAGQRRARRGSDRTFRALIDRMAPIPPEPADGSIERVIDRFLDHPDQTLCPVVDATGAPAGVVPERMLRKVVYHRYGRDLLRNQSSPRETRFFMRSCPQAEMDSDLETGLEAFAARDDAPCLIVTEGGRYAGILLPSTLLAISVQHRLAEASARNPLTGLPGNPRIQAALADAVGAAGEFRFICYFDFDNFKPFNDENGFRVGDRAIASFADILRAAVPGDERNCIGHVGGDDFVVVMFGGEPAEARALVKQILRVFVETSRSLHKERDRLNGWYETRDRYGEQRRFPLLRASCAVAALGPDIVLSESNLLDPVMVRLKSMAKRGRDGLSWFDMTGREDVSGFARELDALTA